MDSNNFEKAAEQAAAFQKVWADSMSKVMRASFAPGQSSPPPELLKQIRSGIFEALAKSWDEFMRSPQFLESMKQWMDNAISFRKLTNDFMGKVRNEMQAPSREDIDTIMLTVRHMEKRLLDQVETLSEQLKALNEKLGTITGNGSRPERPKPRTNARRRPSRSKKVKV